ncbi:hypothetical protein D3C72_132630 [compost metagenome]
MWWYNLQIFYLSMRSKLNAVVVNTKKELKVAIKNSAEEIDLQGKILKQYKAFKLLKKYGLPTASIGAISLFLLKSGKGINPDSFLRNAADQGDKIDPKLIIDALKVIIPVILLLIPIMFALSKDYEEIEYDLKNGKAKFKKKSK